VSQIDTLVRGASNGIPGGMEQKCTTVTFRIFQKRRLVYAQNGKNPLTDYVTDSMTEAVFYPCFGVVYGRF